MAKLIDSGDIKKRLIYGKGLSVATVDKDFIEKTIEHTPKIDAIPVWYILDFIKGRDPVYKSNIITLIKTYNQEVDESDRIPEDLFER